MLDPESCYSRRFYIILATTSLFSGGLIYLFLRPSNQLFYQWFGFSEMESWHFLVKDKLLFLNHFLPDWLIYSLPNGLWAFSYTLLIVTIWKGSKSAAKYFWLASIPILILGYELLQLTGFHSGTFCLQDILLGMSGILLGIITGFKFKTLLP